MEEKLIEALNASGMIEIEKIDETAYEFRLTSAGEDFFSVCDINEQNYAVEITQFNDYYEVKGDVNLILPTIREAVLKEMRLAIKEIEYYTYTDNKEDKYDISFDYFSEQSLVVVDNEEDKEYRIPVGLLHDGLVAEYNIVDRENEIYELERLVGESHMMGSSISDYDRVLMREDLETLKSTDEEYVLSYYGTNGFLTKKENLDEFNEACQALIDSYIKYTAPFTLAEPAIINVSGYYKDDSKEKFNYLASVGDVGDIVRDDDIFYEFDINEQIVGDHGDFVIESFEVDTMLGTAEENSSSRIAALSSNAEMQDLK
jgi:hypothetical protein